MKQSSRATVSQPVAHVSCPCILPAHILEQIVARGSRLQQVWARRSLLLSEHLRRWHSRQSMTLLPREPLLSGAGRVIYDARQTTRLPGTAVRREGEPPHTDPAVNEAYEYIGIFRDFLKEVFERASLDGAGMHLAATVHFGRGLDNAFWNGRQLVHGDGDEDRPETERLFQRFTRCPEVIAHELSHGLIQREANLLYYREPGALNESFADIFGSLARQWHWRQRADEADWVIGSGLFTSRVKGAGVRSLKAPGTAYDDPVMGKDPQPAHMKDFRHLSSQKDYGGVHINSGIPNRAFYVAALEIGGHAWERAGRIWYLSLRGRLSRTAGFGEAARVTFQVAGELYGEGSREQVAVRTGWNDVGVPVR